MKDLSNIFYETINNKEFKKTIKKYNLKVNSSNIQIKRCVVSMEYNPSHIFIIYSNIYDNSIKRDMNEILNKSF